MTQPVHHVVIVGGGFAGLTAALGLRKAQVRVTLLDRRNFHLFQPLLYQVATGGLSPANIATPLRRVVRKAQNVQVLLGEVVGVDVVQRHVKLTDTVLDFDTLIVGTGVRHQYFGHDEWEEHAPGLKSVEDATEIRRRILTAFEAAERQLEPARRDPWLTFVVIGGGPTGVELAGSLGELAHNTLKNDFRTIDPTQARIILLEAGDRILPTFPPELSAKAVRSLEKLGVAVQTGAKVTRVLEHGVTIETGGHSEHIEAYTVLWGAGVKASPLGAVLAQATGAKLDRAGRVIVEPDFSLPGHPNLFVVGDLCSYMLPDGQPLPGVAPAAMQAGRYVADVIRRRVESRPAVPFHYKNKGNLATIGRNAAVADLPWIRLSGWLAWVMWLAVHLFFIILFDNRVMVMFQWAWNYWTRNRSARLITGEAPKLFREPARAESVGASSGNH